MTTEILAPITDAHPAGERALQYLSSALASETIESIALFQKKQQQAFRDHASDLATLLEVIQSAPSDLGPLQMEESLLEWFKEQGVSSSRITQLKGAVRLKRRVLSGEYSYSEQEREFILGLEVEKAYLFGRLTWEGQRQAYKAYKLKGSLSLRDIRKLRQEYEYDPSLYWSDSLSGGRGSKIKSSSGSPSALPLPEDIRDLFLLFQQIIERIGELEGKWISSKSFVDLVDPITLRRLSIIINRLCSPFWEDSDF